MQLKDPQRQVRKKFNIYVKLRYCPFFLKTGTKLTLFILIVGFFYVYFSAPLGGMLINFINNNCESVNEESDSVCESLDDISKEELESGPRRGPDSSALWAPESLKKEISSKLFNIDYETYIKQFWVGLLEGDGTITVSCPGPKHVKVRMFISIKNLRDNVLMLLLIKDVIGGRVRIERNAQYVT